MVLTFLASSFLTKKLEYNRTIIVNSYKLQYLEQVFNNKCEYFMFE